jgi:UDP:flavonoid glycosyltransferase YjiC (YdhE family)
VRVLFTTNPLSGHFFPLVPLAWACRSLGHEVLVTTSDNFVPSVLRAGLPATPCGPDADFADLVPDETVLGSGADRRRVHGRVFARIAGRNLPGTTALVGSWRPDVVVAERAEFAGPIAAAGHGVPCVEVHWGIPALTEFRSAAAAELGPELAALGLDAVPEPARVLNPWPPSLHQPHALGHHSMRHVPYNGDARIPDWVPVPRTGARICLTFGTLLPQLGDEDVPAGMVPLLESLAGLDAEVVVAVDEAIAARWPALPAAVRHVGRMPLSQVLKVSDCSIHHGGSGTCLTALEAGVPQLVLPRFDDQLANAEAVRAAGAGIRLTPEDVRPDAVAKCVLELLEGAHFAAASAAVAAEIAAQPSPVEVVEVLRELTG